MNPNEEAARAIEKAMMTIAETIDIMSTLEHPEIDQRIEDLRIQNRHLEHYLCHLVPCFVSLA